MSSKYIAKAVRRLVRERARNRCEYCQSQADITAMAMEVDHIKPRALSGTDTEDNLCLACTYCNDSKNDRVEIADPRTKRMVKLFNPRTQVWSEHFAWSEDGEQIIGLTDTGNITIKALRLNRSELTQSRSYWAKAGWHPPKD